LGRVEAAKEEGRVGGGGNAGEEERSFCLFVFEDSLRKVHSIEEGSFNCHHERPVLLVFLVVLRC